MSAKVSIIMGIYNCEQTLPEALDSLLAQTYPNWQAIICNDGSADRSKEIVLRYQEKYPDQFIIIENDQNRGLNYTLNHCLQYADGKYIARMDGDDISLPTRLEAEVEFLDSHPEYAIVSCPMIYFDENGDFRVGVGRGEANPRRLVTGTIHPHAPCMVRREAYEAVNGYTVSKDRLRVEDWDLWVRMYEKGYRGYNLEKPLYKMRDDRNAYNRRRFKYRLNEAKVGASAVRKLHLNPICYLLCLRPIIVGLLPKGVYDYLHRRST